MNWVGLKNLVWTLSVLFPVIQVAPFKLWDCFRRAWTHKTDSIYFQQKIRNGVLEVLMVLWRRAVPSESFPVFWI